MDGGKVRLSVRLDAALLAAFARFCPRREDGKPDVPRGLRELMREHVERRGASTGKARRA